MSTFCFHCHQPVPEGFKQNVVILGQRRPMCCYGCQAVAETIVTQDLESFYKFRQTDDLEALPLIPEVLAQEDLSLFDKTDVQSEFTFDLDSGKEAWLAVEGMTCAACAWLIEKHISPITGVTNVLVNSSTDRVKIIWDPSQVKLSLILREIERIGYKARPFRQGEQENQYQKKRRSLIKRLGVAGIASMQTMMVAFGLYFDDIDATTQLYFWWVSLLFTAPVFVYSCYPFYVNAIRAVKSRTLNMDVPVSLAIIFAFFASMYATITNQGEVYFECVTMFAFFLLTGRYLELLAKQKAITDAANLMKLIPSVAEVFKDEAWEQVQLKDLSLGDVVRVKPGAIIPVDGTLNNNGSSIYVNEAQLTGESRPISKTTGDIVYGGSLNVDTPLQFTVTHTYQDSFLASILRLQDEAMALKPKVILFADRISRHLVLGALVIALITYISWMFVEPDRAFWVVLSVLVATCPCALSLAAPTAMSGAVSRLNRLGVLLKHANSTSAVKDIKTICFDKTGTLTEGKFKIEDAWYAKGENQEQLLQIASSLESWSEHPIAHAFKALVKPPVEQIQNFPGRGLQGVHNDTPIRIGSVEFIHQWLPEAESPISGANVILATQAKVLAAWRVDDSVRDDAATTIQSLKSLGLHCVMLTGDTKVRAEEIGQLTGIDTIRSSLTPEDKLACLKQFQKGAPTMMVGDGINDAPVLSGANVSIAFGSGSELAQSSSDVVILNGRLKAITEFLTHTKKLNRVIFQNFVWAFGYNALILPLAAFGFVDPLIAMLGMSMSSIIVISNSLRLMRRS